jgi:membrane-associated PAP2 superfamily phosphatase
MRLEKKQMFKLRLSQFLSQFKMNRNRLNATDAMVALFVSTNSSSSLISVIKKLSSIDNPKGGNGAGSEEWGCKSVYAIHPPPQRLLLVEPQQCR